MRLPHVPDVAGVDAAVVGIPFDTATSFRAGARFGPEGIRSASALLRPYHPTLDVNIVETVSVVDYGDLPVAPGDVEGTYRRIEPGLAPLVELCTSASAIVPPSSRSTSTSSTPRLRRARERLRWRASRRPRPSDSCAPCAGSSSSARMSSRSLRPTTGRVNPRPSRLRTWRST